MAAITVFQCVPAYKARLTNRVISPLKKLNCRILLDLEDSIQDILMPGYTFLLKQNARMELIKLFELNPEYKFDVRVNIPQSEEYKKDMAVLKSFRKNLKSIFLPKTERVEDIYHAANELGEGVMINPIIETPKGIENAVKICVADVDESVEFFFFGNYDFHLHANKYPISEQNKESYWQIVEPLIKMVENRFRFGNSPYSNICDLSTLKYILFRLGSLCSRNFAVMSLHKNQTLEYLKSQPSSLPAAGSVLHLVQKEVISSYITGKLKGRSFAMDKETSRIITPQEYLLALNKNNK